MHPRTALLSAIALSACLSSGCSNGEVGGSGEVSFVLADAATDELVQFEVDVDSIVMTKADGTPVSVMPRATRVDFAELVTVAEMVTTVSLEAGAYTSMQLNLDFSNAAIAIVGQTTPATVVDALGNPITGTVAVQVDFSSRARPLVRRGRHHLFQLDLDLDQAVSVDSGANQVTFTPVLSAVIDPANPRPVATTGILAAVDVPSRSFTIDRIALDTNTIATFTVRTRATTVFQLDGVVSLGTAGLQALASLVGQRVFTQGVLHPLERVLDTVVVEAGAGVPGNGQDWVFGHVTARDNGAGNDAALTVVGRSRDFGTSTRLYNTAHTVNVTVADTKVLRRGAGNSLDTDSIQVGQLVFAFGDLTGTTMDAGASGVVRMLRTGVFGIAAGAPVGDVLTLDVTRFDLRPETAFDFDVGGVIQANKDALTVDVSGLDTTGIGAGSKLHVLGWMNHVDIVGDEDAKAIAIADHTNGAKALLLQWGTPSTTAVAATTPESVIVDVTGVVIAAVGDGFAPVAVTSSPQPVLEPLLGLGVYRIVEGGSVQLFFLFDNFRSALATRAASAGVFRIAALGNYDQPTQVFSALAATVVLQ